MKLILLQVFLVISVNSISKEPILIIVSYDGFSNSLFNRSFTPFMNYLRTKGTYTKLKNVFPTKTCVNHYSLVTGLYPENHGVVSNSMYDPELEKIINSKDPYNMYRYNTDIVPLWVSKISESFVSHMLGSA